MPSGRGRGAPACVSAAGTVRDAGGNPCPPAWVEPQFLPFIQGLRYKGA